MAGEVLGSVDVLVLNTGGPPPGAAADINDAVWSAQFESMFLSAIRLTRRALPGMRQRGFGRIIVVVSSGVNPTHPGSGHFQRIATGLVGWAKTLSSEVAPQASRSTASHRGRIATDRVAELDQGRANKEGLSRDGGGAAIPRDYSPPDATARPVSSPPWRPSSRARRPPT